MLEDGEPQAISSFTLVHGGRTFNLLQPPRGARPRPKAWCCRLPKPRVDDTSGRVLLIFIDDLHFEPEMTPHGPQADAADRRHADPRRRHGRRRLERPVVIWRSARPTTRRR